MKNILFIAPPAGGKGTVSDKLVERCGYKHVSTGDLLRDVDKSSKLGKEIESIISQGKLVNDEIVLELLKEKLKSFSKDEHFILDGFPRNLKQAEDLDSLLNELDLNDYTVIELDVPYDVCLKRAVGRIICPKCHKSFNKYFVKPKIEGICDNCGSLLISRSDDNEDTFKNRYDTYLENTAPLVEYYKNSNLLVKVNGIDNVIESVESVIHND